MPRGSWTSLLPILLGTTSKQVLYLALVGLDVCNGALEFWNLVLGKAFTTTTVLVSGFFGARFQYFHLTLEIYIDFTWGGSTYLSQCVSYITPDGHWRPKFSSSGCPKDPIHPPSHPFTKKVLWGPAAAIIDHWVCVSMKVLLEDRCSNMNLRRSRYWA